MWRSVLLHEFIDHRISNFQAVAGNATPDSFALTPSRDPVAGINSVRITPGKGFEYVLAKPLQPVIGVSCRVRLSYPIILDEQGAFPQGILFSVMRLGSVTELQVVVNEPLPDDRGIIASVRILVGSQFVNLGLVEIPARTFTDLRFDWHTSGQARLSANGRLVGYNNAVAPGASFEIDRVMFGQLDTQSSASLPLYLVARVFVRALLRSDSLAMFSRLLPVVQIAGADMNRCRLRVLSNLLRLLDRLRGFMTTFHQITSQTWSQQEGPPDGPFRPEARQAHDLAVTAVLALSKMLCTGDFTKPDSFLEPFTEFLHILRAALPSQFDTLAAELGAADIVPDECKALFDSSLEQNRQALDPVITLLSAATERVRDISGGY